MWQLLKAVRILFTICPGQQQKKNLSPFWFSEKEREINFFSLLLSQG